MDHLNLASFEGNFAGYHSPVPAVFLHQLAGMKPKEVQELFERDALIRDTGTPLLTWLNHPAFRPGEGWRFPKGAAGGRFPEYEIVKRPGAFEKARKLFGLVSVNRRQNDREEILRRIDQALMQAQEYSKVELFLQYDQFAPNMNSFALMDEIVQHVRKAKPRRIAWLGWSEAHELLDEAEGFDYLDFCQGLSSYDGSYAHSLMARGANVLGFREAPVSRWNLTLSPNHGVVYL